MGHGVEFRQNMVHWRRAGKSLQYSYLENPMNSRERQKDRTLKDKLPRSVHAQYATGKERRNTPERMKRWSHNETNKQTKNA